jgi:hypothetical protein
LSRPSRSEAAAAASVSYQHLVAGTAGIQVALRGSETDDVPPTHLGQLDHCLITEPEIAVLP